MLHTLTRYRHLKQLCSENGLTLSPRANWDSVGVLAAIFRERSYATGFPFYEHTRIIDIGAHKGYFTLFAAQHVGSGSMICAYEPDPSNFSVLQENLARNGIEGVMLHQAAVAAESGRGHLVRSASFNHEVYPAGPDEGDVEVISFASIVEAMPGGEADFAKIDCEGGEYDILLNSPAGIVQRVGTYAIEFHDTKTADRSGRSLLRRFRALGYSTLRFEYGSTRKNLNYGMLVVTKTEGYGSMGVWEKKDEQ